MSKLDRLWPDTQGEDLADVLDDREERQPVAVLVWPDPHDSSAD